MWEAAALSKCVYSIKLKRMSHQYVLSVYMSTCVDVEYPARSAASLQKMIYRLSSQACHRRRLESSPVLPSILWMGTRVPPDKQGGRQTEIDCQSATSVIKLTRRWSHRTLGEDVILLCFGVDSTDPCRSLSIYLFTHLLFFQESFAFPTCWFEQDPPSHSVRCIYSHPGALQYN